MLYVLATYYPSDFEPHYTIHTEPEIAERLSFTNMRGYFSDVSVAEAACRWANSSDNSGNKRTFFIHSVSAYADKPATPYNGPLKHFKEEALEEAKAHAIKVRSAKEEFARKAELSWWKKLFQ